jgi:hypothetical protein
MTSSGRYVVASLVLALVSFLVGCGVSGSAPIAVTLSPNGTKAIDQTQTVGITAMVAHDSKNAGVTWTVTGGGTLSNQTTAGATYVAPTSGASSITATVTATSVTDITKSASLQITVNPAPSISTASLPAATAGTSYPNTTLTESGGTSPFTWSVSPTSLPAGLSFNTSTGVISGTPTGGGSGSYTFKITDAATLSATQALTITVNPPPALTITTTSLSAGVYGTAYSANVAVTGGVPSYRWAVTSGALPAGLTLNTSTGSITGSLTGTFVGTTNFVISVTDSQTPSPNTTTANLSITVSAPALSVTTSSLEGGALGTAYNQTLAATGGITPYSWSISSGSLPAGLSLNASTGVISGTPTGNTTGPTDFTVKATDSETPTAQSATASLSITISAPPLSVTTTSLAVGVAGSAYSASLQATGGVSPYTWAVTTGTLPGGLSLNASTGVISGTPTASGTSPFTVTATDSEIPTHKTATANLSIIINPTLAVSTTSLAAGTTGTAYNQTLAATGGITPYTWAVTAGSLPAGLTLNASSGVIMGSPTGPQTGPINFTVTVTDSENPTKTASANLSITITAPPLSVTTLSLPGGTLGTAYSQTLGATGGITPYSWSISGGSLPAGLTLNASTGIISGTPTGSVTGPINFTVKVTDSEVPTPASATAALSITISAAPLSVVTTSLPTGVDGSTYTATLQAAGGVSPYTWAVTTGSLPGGLTLNASTGVISGTPTGSGTSFTVTVTDSETPTPQTATKNLSITINPQLAITTSSLSNGVVGTAYNQTLAATGGITPYTWNWSGNTPPGLALVASSGQIAGTPTTAGTFSFTVRVIDSENPAQSVTANLSITINAQLQITTSGSLPQGVINVTYSGTTLQAAGGVTPYTWSISAGSLPPGLTLTPSSGLISGTATSTGTFSFTAKVVDSGNPQQTATANLSIVINGPLTITTQSLPSGVLNQSYSATVAATGGITPYTWGISSGSLPTGLSLNSSTGQITGTPTATGTSTFTVMVTDSELPTHQSTTASLSISINNSAPLQVTTTGFPTGVVNSPYPGNAFLNATGGIQPYTWSISAGSLPPGLALTSSTGQISGTPTTSGTYSFTAKVTDSSNPQQTATANLSIVVNAALTITTTSVPNGSVGVSYSATVDATGGVQPYTWTIHTGSLPPGLSLSSSNNIATISGSPTTTGTYPFTIQVVDNEGNSVATGLSISISQGAPLAITTTTLPGANDGQVYYTYLQATGGAQPYSWSVTQGSLPTGLSMGLTTGEITGTPTAAGTASFTVTVTDSETPTATATAQFTISVLDCPNNNVLSGHYAFVAAGWDDSGANTGMAAAGSFVANGSGTISSAGLIDLADQSNSTGTESGTITSGTYCVGSNNLATLTLNLSGISGISSITLAAALDSADHNGHIISYDVNNIQVQASGLLRQQTTSDFSTASIKGNYAFGVIGEDQSGSRLGLVGEFNSNGSGSLSGEGDYDDGGSNQGSGSGNSSLSASDFSMASTGRGTATVTLPSAGNGGVTLNFVFYVVNSSELVMMALDSTEEPPVIFAGQVLEQSGTFSNSSLNGTSILETQGLDQSSSPAVPDVQAGFLTTNGQGDFTATLDENDGGTVTTGNATSGNYSVASNGRVTLTNAGKHPPVFYLISENEGFGIGTDSEVSFGMFQPQSGSDFNNASLTGNYYGGSKNPVTANSSEEVDSVNSNGAGVFSVTSYNDSYNNCGNGNNCDGGPNGSTMSVNYSVQSNGTVTLTCGSETGGGCPVGTTVGYIFIVSDSQVVFLPAQDQNPKLDDFHQ